MNIKGLKRGDTVFVIAGKDKGKSGKILKIASNGRVVVDGVNLTKRHRRPKKTGEKGSIVQVPMPINPSNLLIKCSKCGMGSRRSFSILQDKSKIRVCKKCQAEI